MPVIGEPALSSELALIPGLELLSSEPLARHTRFALGGPARLFLDVSSLSALAAALAVLHASGHPFLLIGGGTNLIVADVGFDGIVLRYRNDALGRRDNVLTAGSGGDLEALVDASVDAGLAGLECLKRIPGWLGGAIYGNAGAHGQQVSEALVDVTFHDGMAVRFKFKAGPLSEFQHDERRFVRLGPDEWATPLYAVAANRCTLSVRLWAGDFSLI